MNVKVTKTEHLNVEISKEEQKRIVRRTLLQLIGMENEWVFLDNDTIRSWPAGIKIYGEKQELFNNIHRYATEDDKAVFRILALLEKAELNNSN